MHRQYESRKEGGRRLDKIEDNADASIRRQAVYIKKSLEKVITAASNSTDNMRTNRIKLTKKQKWEEKQVLGYFKRQTGEISHGHGYRKENLREKLDLF